MDGGEPRIEVIVKIQKKLGGRGMMGVRGSSQGVGRMGGCDPRIDVIVKMQKSQDGGT